MVIFFLFFFFAEKNKMELKKFNGRFLVSFGAEGYLPEVGGRVTVYVRVPESSSFDEGSQFVRIGSELGLHAGRGAPLGQLAESIRGDVLLTPEGEAGHMRGTDQVAEVGQPNGEREVLWMGHVRPDSLHYQLETGRNLCEKSPIFLSSLSQTSLLSRSTELRGARPFALSSRFVSLLYFLLLLPKKSNVFLLCSYIFHSYIVPFSFHRETLPDSTRDVLIGILNFVAREVNRELRIVFRISYFI